MRKLIVFATVSLDGFMAGPENHLGFMVEDEEMDRRMTAELMRTADTIVIGRNAYQDMAAHWPHASDQFAQWMNATPKVVFSKTLEGLAWENSILARGDILAEIDRLKRQSGGDIVVFGDVRAVRSLVGLGMIDESGSESAPWLSAEEAPYSGTSQLKRRRGRAETPSVARSANETPV